MKFGKKEKETQEEEVVRGEIQRVVPDYRVGLNPEQIRIREENGWTNDEVAPPGLTTKEIVHNNIFTYFNLIFLILAILLCLVGSLRNLTFLPVIICYLEMKNSFLNVPLLSLNFGRKSISVS